MNELKIHVERAVRPIIATSQTKLRMRTELYAHILEIYQEEAVRSVDESAASDAAKKRFGPPDELTLELQQSVGRIDWYEGRLDSWAWRREDETELHHAGRLALAYLLVCPLVVLAGYATWWHQLSLGNTQKGPLDVSLEILRFGVPVLVFFAIQTFALVPICARLYRQFEDSIWPKSPALVLLLSIVLAGFVLSTSWVLHFVITGSPQNTVALLYPRWIIFAASVPVAVMGITIAVRREFAAAAPWTELRIDE